MTDSGALTKSGKTVPSEYCFGGKVSDVERIELQVCDYTWTEFKNVRLHPN